MKVQKARYEKPLCRPFSRETGVGRRTCTYGSCPSPPMTCSFGCGANGTCTSGSYAVNPGDYLGTCNTGTKPNTPMVICTNGLSATPNSGSCVTGYDAATCDIGSCVSKSCTMS